MSRIAILTEIFSVRLTKKEAEYVRNCVKLRKAKSTSEVLRKAIIDGDVALRSITAEKVGCALSDVI